LGIVAIFGCFLLW